MAIKRLYDTLVGATVNANQLVENGNFESAVGWTATGSSIDVSNNTAIMTPTNTNSNIYHVIKIIKGHKYLRTAQFYGVNSTAYVNWYGALTKAVSLSGAWTTIADIISNSYDDSSSWRIGFGCSDNDNLNEYRIRNAMVIDLTAYFGSTIADYLYNLETATAGAGVAKLRECGFFTGEYIPHNPGSLESVEARSHVMRGFNQFDKNTATEHSFLNSDGTVSTNSSYDSIVSSFIPVIPNTEYYFKNVWNLGLRRSFVWYDAGKNLALADGVYAGSGDLVSGTKTAPSNAHYVRIATSTSGADTCCINLSSDRNGEYEPYVSHTYDLGTDTLRGLFKLDSENRLYADGDRKTSDGVITRKYGVVDLGTLGFYYNSDYQRWQVTFPLIEEFATRNASLISDKWVADITATEGDNGKMFTVGKGLYFYSTDATNPPTGTLIYPLATPTTEQSTSFTNPQICDPDGTEEYVTNNGIPVGHETRYQL